MFNQPALGHVQVDGAGMAFLEGPEPVNFTQHFPVCPVRDAVAGAAAAQVNVPLRIFSGRKPGVAVRRTQQVHQPGSGRRAGSGASANEQIGSAAVRGASAAAQVRCCLAMVLLSGLRTTASTLAAEKIIGIAHEVLVQGIFVADQDHQRFLLAAADPAGPLPGGHYRSRVADQDADIQVADIDAEFERRGGDDTQQRAVGQPLFDLAAVLGQKSGPVGSDFFLEIADPFCRSTW